MSFLGEFRYREQAAKDADHVYRHVQTILKERGWSCDLVNENDVKLFCKHSSELRLIRGRSLAAELEAKQLPGLQDHGSLLDSYFCSNCTPCSSALYFPDYL